METAQTEYVPSSEALRIGGRGNQFDGAPNPSGSYKSDGYPNGLEKPTVEGDSPVREIHQTSWIDFPSTTGHVEPCGNSGGPSPKAKYYLTTDSELVP
jgi:hypothetical protein